ncbi:MAG: hypothetical protein KDA45_12910, partial [Planctomycetales bacterium]|nr:hypothetical protein [Planctomycetales bacterium]
DGIRALDYLLTRPEVDGTRVGVTGNSGGGTMTTWLSGVESRWTMSAPSCFVTTFLRNAENELPADTEQCPPRALALGLEHEDFMLALAPKPVILLAKERDFFDVRGSEEAYERMRHVYTLLGQPEQVALHVGPTGHGYSIENREAMYGWFNRVTEVAQGNREPEVRVEENETLWCTASGQVAELRPATVFSFTRDRALELRQARGKVQGEALTAALLKVLRLPEALPAEPPPYRILRDLGNRKYPRPSATTYVVETEPDVFAISYMLGHEQHLGRPPRAGQQAVLYVAHRSSDAELRSEGWLREAIESRADVPVFTCDVRGIGESLPNTCGRDSFDTAYGSDYFYAIHGLMLDRPYLGQKTLDVLRVMQWLRAHGYEQIDLIGNGWGALSATLAGTLCERLLGDCLHSIHLHQPLESFHGLATEEDYAMPLAYLPRDVLRHFDLPDCYAALQGKLSRRA